MPTSVTAALRRGELVYDRVFDDVFPLALRRASRVHWTPVEVAVRAAKLLADGVPEPVILDVGAGIGKFCAIAAATVSAKVKGVEHREHFVELGREIFWRDVAAAERFLHGARDGTRVVTYCGWGGTMPKGYELVLRERCAGLLELWRKTSRAA